jgi:cytidylate kinase
MQKINIAIDGFSSTGKSTLAKQLAKELNYTYIDSGAMYRAISLYFLRNDIDWTNHAQMEEALKHIELSFVDNRIRLNGIDVDDEIRGMVVSNVVSEISAHKEIRDFATNQQRQLGEQKGVVMDGRDIGTTVFPNAELKLFLTSQPETRAQRRFDEMVVKHMVTTIEEVTENLKHRDEIDSTREISPLRKADDAIELDNTNYTMEEQLAIAKKWASEKIG